MSPRKPLRARGSLDAPRGNGGTPPAEHRDFDKRVDSARLTLGQRIRELRSDRGISGRTLATQVGVTSGFISQVESGATTPSVATLVKFADALDVHVGDFFDAPRPSGVVLRREDRAPYEYPDLGIVEVRLCTDPQLGVVWARFEPGGATGDELFAHGTDAEWVLVLKGTVTMMLGSDEYVLRAGDVLHFSGELPHGCKNTSGRPAEVVWAVTPGGTF